MEGLCWREAQHWHRGDRAEPVTFSCKNETLTESESSVGVSKTNGNQVGFWAVGMMDVKAPKGRGGQERLKTKDFQTQEMRVSSEMPSQSVRDLSFGIHVRAERRERLPNLYFI